MLFLIHHCLRQTVGRSLEDRPTVRRLLSSLRQPFQNPLCPLPLCAKRPLSLSPTKGRKRRRIGRRGKRRRKEEKHAPHLTLSLFPVARKVQRGGGRRRDLPHDRSRVQSPESSIEIATSIVSKKGGKATRRGWQKGDLVTVLPSHLLKKGGGKKFLFWEKGTLFVFFGQEKGLLRPLSH